MRKRNWQLPVLLAVLAVCVGGYLGIRAWNDAQEKRKAEESEAAKLYLSDLGKVNEVTVRNGSGTFAFRLEDGVWSYPADPGFPLDQSRVDSLVSTLTSQTAIRSFEPGESLSAYGLDQPAYTLTAGDVDGNTLTLLIGGTADSNYYAMKEGGTLVYTISTALVTDLNYKLNDLVELDTFPALTEESLTGVAIASGGSTLTLEKETVTKTEAESQADPGSGEQGADAAQSSSQPETTTEYVWYVVRDGVRTPAAEFTPASGESAADVTEKLVSTLAALSFDSCADYKADAQALAGYGLEAPALTLTVNTGQTDENGQSQSFTVTVGKLSGDASAYYAVKDGSRLVSLLKADTVAALQDTLSAFQAQ